MSLLRNRNNKRRKVFVKTPGAKTVIRYLRKKPSKPVCAETGQELHGIPRVSATKMKNTPKTHKRPERPYGGVLSSFALRKKLKANARAQDTDDAKAADLIQVGRLCVKTAGRDAGFKCVIVEVIDDNFVTIDGQTRRRKCNINHLEPLGDVLSLKKGASTADVKKAFEKIHIEMAVSKPRKATTRPKKSKATKVKEAKPANAEKKAEEPKEEKPAKTEAKATKAAGDKK